ncbi:hypothetical protein BC833DRAFT_582072 [Globomyces pollinis-pini]|nr:hypothetical protein BC833DRAFT_582072 [Globomyces pollinis-pini]
MNHQITDLCSLAAKHYNQGQIKNSIDLLKKALQCIHESKSEQIISNENIIPFQKSLEFRIQRNLQFLEFEISKDTNFLLDELKSIPNDQPSSESLHNYNLARIYYFDGQYQQTLNLLSASAQKLDPYLKFNVLMLEYLCAVQLNQNVQGFAIIDQLECLLSSKRIISINNSQNNVEIFISILRQILLDDQSNQILNILHGSSEDHLYTNLTIHLINASICLNNPSESVQHLNQYLSVLNQISNQQLKTYYKCFYYLYLTIINAQQGCFTAAKVFHHQTISHLIKPFHNQSFFLKIKELEDHLTKLAIN